MIVWLFCLFTFQCEIRLLKLSSERGYTFQNGTFCFTKITKITKDNMKRSIITDQVNVFFSFWENNNNNNNNCNAVSLQKNITEPFRRPKTQHRVDTRSLRFGNKTVKDIRSFIITLIRLKKAKGSYIFNPITDDLNWPEGLACYMSV